MAHRVYTSEEKAHILARLQLNGNDINLTSAEFGVPERTLYTWRRRFYAEDQRRQPPSPPPPMPDFENDLDALAYLRRKIMNEMLSVANSFEGVQSASPAQRINLLSQLMDRLLKLDDHLKPYRPQPRQRIVMDWYAGLYIRSEDGYRGPFAPSELPPRWQEKYGKNSRLEIYWGDDTFSIVPEGLLDDVRNFLDDPSPLVEDDLDEEGYEIGYGDNKWGAMPGGKEAPLIQQWS